MHFSLGLRAFAALGGHDIEPAHGGDVYEVHMLSADVCPVVLDAETATAASGAYVPRITSGTPDSLGRNMQRSSSRA
ncbi:hypothetical protein GCM10010486_38350 [Nonomuraea roseoviolacea subsp. carminata]